MADRRMFSRSILLSDDFLDLSSDAQRLYFFLNLEADDDGFVGSPKTLIRSIGAQHDSLSELCRRGYVLLFASGIVVVTAWLIHNTIKNDRYKQTIHQKEKNKLLIEPRTLYSPMDPECFQNGSEMDPERIHNKIKQTNVNKGKEDMSASAKPNGPSSIPYSEIVEYLNTRIGSSYRPTANATMKLIKNRWDEGYRLDDFYHVIDNMYREWGNDNKMRVYLRPQTLFGTKFESYLNRLATSGKETNGDNKTNPQSQSIGLYI